MRCAAQLIINHFTSEQLASAALLGAAIAKFAKFQISNCKFSEPDITAYMHQLARKKAREEVVTRRQNMVIAAQGVVGGRSNEPAQCRSIGQALVYAQLYSHNICCLYACSLHLRAAATARSSACYAAMLATSDRHIAWCSYCEVCQTKVYQA